MIFCKPHNIFGIGARLKQNWMTDHNSLRNSIIITTHNRADFIEKCVESAKKASSTVEVVVVNDASSDHTDDVCRKIPGINYVRLDKNRGTAGARNAGIDASSGEYIGFLDD